jgi:hypothetical protein
MFKEIESMSLNEMLQTLDRYYTLQEEIDDRIKLLENAIWFKAGNIGRRTRRK